jgi:UDP-GlcNAc:undecaprenyl-phosphate GlcNAc-1-phosphate transferase
MAVIVLYGFAAASGLVALSIKSLSIGITLVLILLYFLFVIFFWIYLARVKVYEEKSVLYDNGLGPITPIVVQFTYRRRLFEVILDLIIITTAYYIAYLLRFEGPVYYLIGEDFSFFLKSLPIVVSCHIFCFYILGVYRGIWESTGISDLIDYIKAITLGSVGSMLILLFVYRFISFSRAVFIIHWVLMLVLISLSRLSFRLVDEGIKKGKQKGKPTVIYGAGAGGRMAAKEIENNPSLGLIIEGFMDDNPRKLKKKIMGYPVLGGRDELEKVIKKKGIKEIIVSFKANGEEARKELRSLCQKMNAEVEVKRMKMVLD